MTSEHLPDCGWCKRPLVLWHKHLMCLTCDCGHQLAPWAKEWAASVTPDSADNEDDR